MVDGGRGQGRGQRKEQPAAPDAAAFRPSPEEVDLLLAGLGRLIEDAALGAGVDEDLFGECQAELARLQAIDDLTEDQTRAAVDLLYRWNEVTHSDAPPPTRPGLYPDPAGRYRKRYWTGTAWGAGVGRPKKG